MVCDKSQHECSELVQDQLEEAEDTLSLCDLPIYGDFRCDDWSDGCLSKESRASDSDQDFFEFSSHEFDPQSFPSESVVFCGKIIPYKKKPILISERPHKPGKQRGRLSRWMSLLFRWGISSNRSCVDKYGSLQNSRWHLFVFGLGRFPVEMELRDIKTRQSRLKWKAPSSTVSANFTIDKKSRNRAQSGDGKPSLIGCLPLP